MISVALAAYCGEQYIEAQLNSILSQLGPEDEVVVSDDAPGGPTETLVRSLAEQDPRIRYVEGPGKGVIANFNHAISKTVGDYIFLADQDDVWLPDKVAQCVAALGKNPTAPAVVLHNARVVDAELHTIDPSFFASHGSKPGYWNNVIKNSYMGCCMAFTAALKAYILPLPLSAPMHDQYIGLQAEKYGTVTFIQEPLLLYRQHGNNVTGRKTSLFEKLKWRVSILKLTQESNPKEMRSPKKVSACIVTYNNERVIEEAVRTMLDSVKYDNFTLYVVDNGSTDHTLEILKTHFASDPRFCLIETGVNAGFGAGHNKVLEFLDSDYHCVVNPDVIIKDDIVASFVDYCEAHPDVVQLSPRIRFPDGRDQILGKRYPHIWYIFASHFRKGDQPGKVLSFYARLKQVETGKPFAIQNATGCFMFFRTEAFRKVGGFDSRYFMYFEDCDITREMQKLGKVLFFPEATVYHAWERGSKTNDNLRKIHIESMLKFYLKWKMI